MSQAGPLRTVVSAVREGKPVPAIAAAQLEAIGIDVGALVQRLQDTQERA